MPRALILGGGGQDGSYLSRLLLNDGYDVSVTLSGAEKNTSVNLDLLGLTCRVKIVASNLRTGNDFDSLLSQSKYDEIYNLMAMSSVGQSIQNPIQSYETNAMGVAYLLDSIKRFNPEARVLQASSSEIFGGCDVQPYTETSRINPCSPYGSGKAFGHYIARDYRIIFGIAVQTVILFNHESSLRSNKFVFKKIISSACDICDRGSPDPLKLGNLDISRDWGYAPEYAQGMQRILHISHPDEMILCTGTNMSLRQICEYAFEYFGLSLHWEIANGHEYGFIAGRTEPVVISDLTSKRPRDILKTSGSCDLAVKKICWGPRYFGKKLVNKLISNQLSKTWG